MPSRNIYIIFLIVSLFSCSKKRECVIDLNVKSSVTNQALNGYATIEYSINGYEKSIPVGSIKNGQLGVKIELPRNVSSAKLHVFFNQFYSIPGYDGPSGTFKITKGLNRIDELIDPIYRMEISIHNVSCQGTTDTAWVNFVNSPLYNPKVFTGCASGIPGNLPIWYTGNNVTFRIVSKKNNVIDTVEINEVLQAETINQFTLEY